MNDKRKTKQQLIEELGTLREQIAGPKRAAVQPEPGALAIGESWPEALIQVIPDMIVRQARDGTYLACRVSRDFEPHVPPYEFVGKRIDEVLPPDVAGPALEAIERACETGSTEIFEYQLPLNGEKREFEARIVAVDKNEIVAVVRDITDRKRAERELQESDKLFSKMFNAAPSVTIISSLDDGKIINVNDTFTQLTGRRKEDVIGQPATELNLWRDPKVRSDIIEHLRRDGSVSGIEAEFVGKSGTILVGLMSAVTMTLSGRRCVVWQGIDITARVEAERSLRESEEQYHDLYESAPDMYFTVGTDGTVLSVNRVGAESLGYSREELIGYPVWTVVHQDDIADVKRQLSEIGAQGDDEGTLEFRKVRKDGSVLWVHERVRAISGPDGQFREWRIVCRDLTERRRSEDALRLSEERYRTLVETISHGILEISVDGKIIICNPALAGMLGYEEAEVLGKDICELLPSEEERTQLRTYHDMVLQEQPPPGSIQGKLQTKDGRLVDVQVDWTYRRDETGNAVGFTSVITDVTERKRAEEALQELNQELEQRVTQRTAYVRAVNEALQAQVAERQRVEENLQDTMAHLAIILESLPVVSYTARASDLAATYISNNVTAITGYTPHDFVSNASFWVDRVHPEDLPGLTAALSAVSEKEFVSHQYRWRISDGSYLWFDDSLRVVTRSDGRAGHIVGMWQDITERKRAEDEQKNLEAQLRQSQKMEALGTLAAGVAHDFGNLLTAMVGYADTAKSMLSKKEDALPSIDGIQHVADQAVGLINALLTFSQKAPIERKPIHLSQLITDSVRVLRRIVPSRIEIITNLPEPDDLWVNADATQLQQVLMNLAVNARDAMPTGGQLKLSVRPEDSFDEEETAALVVEDTGFGMSDEVQARVFEPFFTTKAREEGTGLGMAVVHGIVAEHSGGIELESAEGQGTRVVITFPTCSAPSADAVTPAEPAEVNGSGETIIVAEDSREVRAIISGTLAAAGYTILQATTGTEAFEIFRAHERDTRLMILDVDLPKQSGVACLEKAREIRPDLPAIMLSVLSDNDLDTDLGDNVSLLYKPFRMAELATLVTQALESVHSSP